MTSDPTIRRLRRANPVREPLPAGEAALFTEITAQPGDPRLAAPSRPHRRRGLVLLAAAGAAAVLASAAYGVSQWVLDMNDVVKPPVTRQEYRDAQAVIPIPPGATWPGLTVRDDTVTTRGGGGSFALSQAMTLWECYWAHAIRTGDGNAAARSQAVLQGFLANRVYEAPEGAPEGWTPTPQPAGPFLVFAHDGGLDMTREAYRQAAAGDASGVAQFCRANS